jgi:hypothetical protein
MTAATTLPQSSTARAIITTGVLALVLLAGAVLQIFNRSHDVARPVSRVRIADVIPKASNNWTVSDELLGPTEASSQSALKTLNLDDYVYRRFQRGGTWFTIYAAYWAPGRMPTRLVASHTPDRCWTENGMRCVEMNFRQAHELNGKPLFRAEERAFTGAAGGEKTYVAYWHLVEGRLYDYGGRFNAIPHPWLWWKDTVAQAMYGSREQVFVRVASNISIGDLWRDADFDAVMSTVAGMGLYAKPAGS